MMIRPATLMLLVLVAGAVGAVFFVSHEVSTLDGQLRNLNAKIEADYDALHVLRAEWGYLNQPQRLAVLAARHLDLQPLTGSQMVRRQPLNDDIVAVRVIEDRPVIPGPTHHLETPVTMVSGIRPDRRPPANQAVSDIAIQVQAAEIGEMTENRPIDAIHDLVEHVIAIAIARTEGGRQ